MINTLEYWETPPIIKVYEALGAVADGRVEQTGEGSYRVFSSSRGKFYTVTYEQSTNRIMGNDNGSYFKGYLGYPAIAVLFIEGVLPFAADLAEKLKDIAWKDLNQQYKNDFAQTQAHIEQGLSLKETEKLRDFSQKTLEIIGNLNLQHLGSKTKPPEGY